MGMTIEDLKEQYSMRDIVERYGLHPDRSGFLHCPFHQGDRTASLKVYKNSFYCFGCAAHGDIFNFVMLMDGCDFKTAFKSLGGDGGRMSDAAIIRMRRRRIEAERYKKKLEHALTALVMSARNLHYWESVVKVMEPFSDDWCSVQNIMPMLGHIADTALSNYLDVIDEGK